MPAIATAQLPAEEQKAYAIKINKLSDEELAREFAQQGAATAKICGVDTLRGVFNQVKAGNKPDLTKIESKDCLTGLDFWITAANESYGRANGSVKQNSIVEQTDTYYFLTIEYPSVTSPPNIEKTGRDFCLDVVNQMYTRWVEKPVWPPRATGIESSQAACQIVQSGGDPKANITCLPGWVPTKFDTKTNELFLSTPDTKILSPDEELNRTRPVTGSTLAEDSVLSRDRAIGFHFFAVLKSRPGSASAVMEFRGVKGADWAAGIYNEKKQSWELPADCSIKFDVGIVTSAISPGRLP